MSSQLSNVKLLLGLSLDGTEYDDKIALVLELIQNQALIYIGRAGKAPPAGLEAAVVQMAVDYLQQNPMGIDNLEGNMKSIERGDTKITYNIADAASMGAFIGLYRELLRPFMKVRMR